MKLLLSIFIAIAVFRHAGAQIQSCPLGYAVLVPCCATSKDLSSSTSQIYCPSGCMSKNLSVWGTEIYTENTAVCLAAIHAGKVSNGGGYITVQKLPGQEMYIGSTMNGIISLNYGISATSFTFLGYSTQAVASTISPNTTTTSNPTSAIVTSTSVTVTTSTMATNTIFPTSPVTSATTTVTTTKLISTTIPMSSTKNNIATNASTATTATTITAVNIGKVDCYTYLDLLTGDPLMILCPPNCNSSYFVYGTDIYTSDSDLCPSAIHAGATTVNGGYVTVKRKPLQGTYIGSTRNGIKSSSTTSLLVMESFMFL
ncbi:clotting factor C-like [Hyla sarda]|uniref:clotting factor C-like n=1 Tax=Hyla sarda TaxID=327740 RepID=UPI0024C37A55|nr:clotting factor C-like [Hyla sarda]